MKELLFALLTLTSDKHFLRIVLICFIAYVWITLCFVSAHMAHSRGRKQWFWFLLSIPLTPFIPWIILKHLGDTEQMKQEKETEEKLGLR